MERCILDSLVFARSSLAIAKMMNAIFLICGILTVTAWSPGCSPRSLRLYEGRKEETGGTNGNDRWNKIVWYGAEWFGEAARNLRRGRDPTLEMERYGKPKSLEECVQRLKEDYERNYFLSGQMDVDLYDENCEFSDPFVKFNGRDRFMKNLSNLGNFIYEYKVKTLDMEEDLMSSPPSFRTRLLVSLRLRLPWKPLLSWPWGVMHILNPSSFLIERHIESWDVSPSNGIRQLFTPRK